MDCSNTCNSESTEQESLQDFLGRDHDRLDELLHCLIAKQEDTPQAITLFQSYSAGLKRHLQWEEELLFPVYERHTATALSGPTTVMRIEHGEIKALLGIIEDNLCSKADNRLLIKQLAALLTSHHLKEERILYPAMANSFTGEETRDLLHKMMADTE